MTKKSLFLLAVLFCGHLLLAQKASDVLEKSIRIKTDRKMYFQYKDNIIKYHIAKDILTSANFIPLRSSELFLSNENSVNIYIRPLNPLNYSFEAESKLAVDPINEAAAKTLSSILDILKKAGINSESTSANLSEDQQKGDPCDTFKELIEEIEEIETALKDDQKSSVVKIFKKLKSLDFQDKDLTIRELTAINKDISELKDHFSTLDTKIQNTKKELKDQLNKVNNILKKTEDRANEKPKINLQDIGALLKIATDKKGNQLNTLIEKIDSLIKLDSLTKIEMAEEALKYDCFSASPYVVQYILNEHLRNLEIKRLEQRKRFENLQKLYKFVADKKDEAIKNEIDKGCDWCLELNSVSLKKDSLVVYTIKLKEGGYKLSDKNEIVSIDSKDKISKTFKVRKFQLFVPEVSVGVAYTSFEYNTYGTTTDSSGQMVVASPVEKMLSNLKISSMVNFNLYIHNSAWHPFYQIGASFNNKMPTLMSGIGFRSNINGVRRLAVSAGYAATWIKELNELKVGDKVLGTDDIERDLKFQFSWPPKPYIGIQINF